MRARRWWMALACACQVEPTVPAAIVETPAVDTDVVDPCPDVPDDGACDGNTLITCKRDHPKRTECEERTCGLGDDGLYACLVPELHDGVVAAGLEGSASVLEGTLRSDGGGFVSVDVDAAGLTSFLVQAVPPAGQYTWVTALRDPDGVAVRMDDPMLNTSMYAGADVALAWPSRLEDGALKAGVYNVTLRVVDVDGTPARYQPVEVSVLRKVDEDPRRGALHVRIVYAGVSQVPSDLADAVSRAVDGWQSIYRRYGLQLVVDEQTAEGVDAIIPAPGEGDPMFFELAAQTENTDVVVLIAEDFVPGVDLEVLAQAGSIPGSPGAGPRALVGVSWLRHAGQNGRFNADEISSLATTLAHEVGHYAGLFHPTEFSWADFDPLSDTPECDGDFSCFQLLGTNLMFPASTCFRAGCEDEVTLSDQQVGVLQLYPGTL